MGAGDAGGFGMLRTLRAPPSGASVARLARRSGGQTAGAAGDVELGPGELYVVPKGVRHNPVAEEECELMLIERKSTLHTGDVVTDKTRSLDEQLRPV